MAINSIISKVSRTGKRTFALALYIKRIQKMKLNSIEDVNALTEYQKIAQIERIEKKYIDLVLFL